MTKHFSALSFLLLTTAAWADATPQGAADLTAVFQTYLGKTPGVVNVVADGDAYAVTLDAAPLLAMVPAEAKATVSMTPYKLRLADKGDGTWDVTQDQPLQFSLSAADVMTMTASVGALSCKGTFDSALLTFTQNDCTLRDIVIDQTVQDPNMGEQVVHQAVKEMILTQTGTAGAAGGVDGTLNYSGTGISETIAVPTGPGAPPMAIQIALDGYKVDGTVTGMRNDAILKALAWGVANASPELMMQNKAAMKAILEGGLPLFQRIDMTLEGTNLSAQTPVGPVTVATVGAEISMKGAVEDGLLREAFHLDGIKPPPGVLPPFAEPLVPDQFSIDFAVQSFDAGAAAKLLLGLFDLAPGAEPGPDFEDRLMRALMPDGTVDIVIAPGKVANATYTLVYEGRMQAGPGGMPTGTAKVTATGYDAAMAILDGAPEQMKSGVVPAMGMARGLAKQQDDGSLLWEIDASRPGTLLVNGMDLMSLQ